ncbi:MAG: DUF4097 family beta strand repeat protein [Gemmatimonadetes bacterium]|nr:DUF4097 family beta strand repeat protein [Gemmatimonadota bacterium]
MRTLIAIAALLVVPFGLSRAEGVPRAFDAPSDTVVEARTGDRVRVVLTQGRVVIENGRDDRLAADDDGDPEGVRIVRRGSTLEVTPRRPGAAPVLRIRVPLDVDVEVRGEDVDVDATGVRGTLSVQVVEGDLRARDIDGSAELRTISGDVDVRRVSGSVRAATVDGRVDVHDAGGDVSAESMDGDVVVERVGGSDVEAVTVDGDVRFAGVIRPGGRVRLVTHDGDVTAEVPEDTSADVEVSTYDGEFMPDFPVRVGRVEAGRPLRFRMGAGGARLELQAFDGDIQLRSGPGR